jgi:hypothetical protein
VTDAVGFGASVALLAAVLNLLNRRFRLVVRVAILAAVVLGVGLTVWAITPRGKPF